MLVFYMSHYTYSNYLYSGIFAIAHPNKNLYASIIQSLLMALSALAVFNTFSLFAIQKRSIQLVTHLTDLYVNPTHSL